jgi:NAD(P)-dependent dehydrogenase (short-subunit alcohol dehydrogenase family)
MPEIAAGPLSARVALVTGGARGIGLAIASNLARGGATVVIGDADYERAAPAAAALSGEGLRVSATQLNVADDDQVTAVMSDIGRQFGRLDLLVNNACRANYRFLFDMSVDDWDDAIAVCLTGTFLCSLRAAPLMRDRGGGRIVNVSSVAARVGLARTTAYAAAKGGVEAMTRVLAAELGAFNIQVNAVAPGPVETDFSRAQLTVEARTARLDRMPAGRFGTVDEVAALVRFLCTDEAQWVTGAVFAIDGGFAAAGTIEKWAPAH